MDEVLRSFESGLLNFGLDDGSLVGTFHLLLDKGRLKSGDVGSETVDREASVVIIAGILEMAGRVGRATDPALLAMLKALVKVALLLLRPPCMRSGWGRSIRVLF